MEAEVGYTLPPDFKEEVEDSLVEIDVNDSTELWLIHLPDGQPPDFDGKELSLDLHHDGQLGSLEGSSGKVYNMVSYSSRESDATVFVSSPAGPRVAGKISRNVSLVHYPDPNELIALSTEQKQMHRSTSTYTRTHTNPFQSMSKRSPYSQSKSRSTHSSRKSNLSEAGDLSKSSKRTAGESSWYGNHRNSGPGQSGTTGSEPGHSGLTFSGVIRAIPSEEI